MRAIATRVGAREGLAVDASRQRVVGMRVDVVDAAFRRHLVDHGDVAVGVVDDGPGPDADLILTEVFLRQLPGPVQAPAAASATFARERGDSASWRARDRRVQSGPAYVSPSQALTSGCSPGHVSGPPVSGWWQRRPHLATSYSKVGSPSLRTIVSGREHLGHARDSRRMTVGMTTPCNPRRTQGLWACNDDLGQKRQFANE